MIFLEYLRNKILISGQFLVDITAPNALNLISENTMERYSTCEMFLRLLSNDCFEKMSPSRTFLRFYHRTEEQTPEISDIIASILEFIPDRSFQADQTLPKTRFSLQLKAKYFAWSLTMRCIHYRLKMRLTDTSGKINPFYRNINSLRYCNTSFYIQLCGRDRILNIMRKHPVIFPNPEYLDKEMRRWKVNFNFCIFNVEKSLRIFGFCNFLFCWDFSMFLSRFHNLFTSSARKNF